MSGRARIPMNHTPIYWNASPLRSVCNVDQYVTITSACSINSHLSKPPKPGQQNGQVAHATNTNSTSAYTAQASTTGINDQWSFLPKLQQDIIRFILSQENHVEGIHISAIARHLQHEDAAKIGYVHTLLCAMSHAQYPCAALPSMS